MALEMQFPFNDGGTVRMSTLELAAVPRVPEMRCDMSRYSVNKSLKSKSTFATTQLSAHLLESDDRVCGIRAAIVRSMELLR